MKQDTFKRFTVLRKHRRALSRNTCPMAQHCKLDRSQRARRRPLTVTIAGSSPQ